MQADYFVLGRARSQHHPLLAWDQSSLAFRKGTPVPITEPIKLTLGEPVPPQPVMVDHHSLPQPVVSPRLKNVLEQMQLHGVQLVPADVRAGDIVLRYWLLHFWHRIGCMDRERSQFTLSPSGRVLLSLDRLVLDENVLGDVPLPKRLAFRLAGAGVHLVHRAVVDRVMGLTPPPEGLRFIPVPEWNDSAGFR